LAVITLAVFWQVNQYNFLDFDDNIYVTENSHTQSGITLEGFRWAFSTTYAEFWHPLTWLSLMLDYNLYGLNAGGYHMTSVILHILSTLLLFSIFNRMTGAIWKSAFIAAIFALHPLRVESVVWVAERKDVLSIFFGLASIYSYALYVEKFQFSKYLLSLILFAFSLMAKSTLVTLPFVLMLLDYWPLGRWQKALTPVKVPIAAAEREKKQKTKKRKADSMKEKKISTPINSRIHSTGRILWEKAPFIFLTIISSIVTILAQNKGGMLISMESLPFFVRIQNAVIYYVFYLGKIFWPVDLTFFIPMNNFFPLWQILASCFILTIITITVIYAFKKLPFLFVGWFWYLGTLIPVIGLVKSSSYAIADRFTYLPCIGIAIMLIWGIPLLFSREDIRKKILFPAGIGVLAILTILTWKQCGYWKNIGTLSRHALQVTKDNYLSHDMFGNALVKEGKIEEAMDQFNEAIRLNPDYSATYYNRGLVYSRDLGQYQRAIEDFNEAIRLQPDYAKFYNIRGGAYYNLGQYQRAIEDFNEAIRLKPDYAYPYYNRGLVYAKDLGQYQRGIEDFNEAIRLKSDYLDAYFNRGAAYLSHGNKELGCPDAQNACELGNCKLLEMAKSKEYCR
jgi:Flp pilus assembly protein TadD